MYRTGAAYGPVNEVFMYGRYGFSSTSSGQCLAIGAPGAVLIAVTCDGGETFMMLHSDTKDFISVKEIANGSSYGATLASSGNVLLSGRPTLLGDIPGTSRSDNHLSVLGDSGAVDFFFRNSSEVMNGGGYVLAHDEHIEAFTPDGLREIADVDVEGVGNTAIVGLGAALAIQDSTVAISYHTVVSGTPMESAVPALHILVANITIAPHHTPARVDLYPTVTSVLWHWNAWVFAHPPPVWLWISINSILITIMVILVLVFIVAVCYATGGACGWVMIACLISDIICLGCFGGLVISIRNFFQRRHQKKMKKVTKAELAKLNITPDHPLYSVVFDFYIPPERIQETELIAAGGFGSVSRAVYRDEIVAVKKMHELIQSDPKALEEFAREAHSLVHLTHPNVVRFVGATLKLPNIFLVTEYCAFGGLDTYLNALKERGEDRADTIVGLLQQAAVGLAFVHSKRMIHRDVKAANFFVSIEDYMSLGKTKQRTVVKVGDLGLAVNTKNKTVSNVGTPGYSAPEIYMDTYSAKVDVFSFGMTIWACLTGKEPFQDANITNPMQIMSLVNNGQRPSLNGIPEPVCDLITRCWTHQHRERPTMAHVASELKRLGSDRTITSIGPMNVARRSAASSLRRVKTEAPGGARGGKMHSVG